MATLKTLSSGSHGNCYILDCDGEQLLIELGISWKDIIRGLDYDLSKVIGCLVSHRHQDHALSIPNAIKFGLSVYSCQDVEDIYPKVKVLKKGVKMRLGGYSIQAIPLQHSVECYGFLIEHPSMGKTIFATDCTSIPYRFKDIQHFLVEANNEFDEMVDNLCDNNQSMSHNENHMELSDTVDFLQQNYSSSMQNILLIHLSSANIDAQKAKKRIQDELGFSNVYVAEKNLCLDLLKDEF